MQLGRRGLAAFIALATPGLAREPVPEAQPGAFGFAPDRLERLTRAFQGYVERGELPGAVVLIARDGRIAYYRAFGHRDAARTQPMTTDTIFRLPITHAVQCAAISKFDVLPGGKRAFARP